MALDDELLNRVTWKIPNALALVGSAADGERNRRGAARTNDAEDHEEQPECGNRFCEHQIDR